MNIIDIFSQKIHNSLKIQKSPANNAFIITDTTDNINNKKLNELHIFTDKNNILVLKQQNNHAIDKILTDMPTAKKCDCMIITEKNEKLSIIFCEIKTTLTKKEEDKAKEQIFSSNLFIDYLISYYNKYLNDFLSQQTEEIEIIERKNIIIYVKLGISNKSKPYISDLDINSAKIVYYRKQVNIDDNGIARLNYNDFC